MLILGHRGGRGSGWPAENSLEAFERAFAEGADGLELDVRLCASGEAMLLHDRSLLRVSNDEDVRAVSAVKRRDLPKLVGGLHIPDLDEALDLCAARGKIVNVEVKADVPSRLKLVRAVAQSLKRARSSVDVVLSSFDPMVTLALAALAPKTPCAQLIGLRTPRLAVRLPLAMRRWIVAAHLEDSLVTPARIERLHTARMRVVAWTVNDPERARALQGAGLDWLITDQPAQIIAACRRSAS